MHLGILAAVTVTVTAALAAPLPASARAEPARSGPWSLELVDEGGAVLPTFVERGRAYVLGALGQRYLLRVRNESARRVEVVASVDGRDVLDGRPAAWAKRGYVVEPYGEVTIDGFRLSDASVAAFRFSSVPRSYAARMGDARDVGVVGVAVFAERHRPPPRWYGPRPYEREHDHRAAPGARSDAAPAPTPEAHAGAPSAGSQAPADAHASRRPGLGTEFGEERESHVYGVSFERASARPAAQLTLRYDDREGLLAAGVDVDGRRGWRGDEAWTRRAAEPFRRDPPFSEPPPGWRPW